MRYWLSDNRTSHAVLHPLRAIQKGNLVRSHSGNPQTLRQPGGAAMYCHRHREDWSFHPTNEKIVVCWLLIVPATCECISGRICSDNFTCCHTEIEAADQTFHLTQSQYIDTGPTSPSADPITPGAWQGSHWSANV